MIELFVISLILHAVIMILTVVLKDEWILQTTRVKVVKYIGYGIGTVFLILVYILFPWWMLVLIITSRILIPTVIATVICGLSVGDLVYVSDCQKQKKQIDIPYIKNKMDAASILSVICNIIFLIFLIIII